VKTENCKRGHPLVEGNLVWRRDRKTPECAICKRERGAERREREREFRRRAAAQDPTPVKRGRRPKEPEWNMALPAEPFANWLTARLEEDESLTLRAIALASGVSDKRLQDIRNGVQDTVHIDVIDRVFVEAREHQALEGLYPLEGLRETKMPPRRGRSRPEKLSLRGTRKGKRGRPSRADYAEARAEA
jgi:hypothetical protein